MRKNNSLKIFFVSLFSIVLFSSFVLAANTATLVTPAEDGSVSGASYVLNATLDTNSLAFTNATFFYDDGSANTTIASVLNDTAADTVFNVTWDSTGTVDVNNLIFWVNITNSTTASTLDSSTGVDIDNGNPTATLSSGTFSDNLHLVSSTGFTIGLDADDTIGISSCNVYYTNDNDNSVISQAVSASANACTTTTTPTAQSLAINQAYTVTMGATDGNGDETNSSSLAMVVTPASGGGGGSGGGTTGGTNTENNGNDGSSGGSGNGGGSSGSSEKSVWEWIWYIISFQWIWNR